MNSGKNGSSLNLKESKMADFYLSEERILRGVNEVCEKMGLTADKIFPEDLSEIEEICQELEMTSEETDLVVAELLGGLV